jgi:hypothetical protein
MSGPKISVYRLSEKQRQNLRAQLNCLRRGVIYCEEIKKAADAMNGLSGRIQSLLSTFDVVNQRTGDCSGEIASLNELQSALPQECQSLRERVSSYMSYTPAFQAGKTTLTDAELSKKQEDLSALRSLRDSAAARQKGIEETLRPMEVKAKQGISAVENAIAADVSGVRSFFVDPSESAADSFAEDGFAEDGFAARKKAIEEQLRVLSLSGDCPPNLKGDVVSAGSALSRVTNKEQLAAFQAITIKPLLQKIEYVRTQALEQKRAFEHLQSRYMALCSVTGTHIEAFVQKTDETDETNETDGAVEKMRVKIAALEKQIVMQTEQEYIQDCVNEVMAEMGYDVIGNRSVTKRSGKKFKNELFSYGEGTAINVTYDPEGQIAIELGGIDRTDRIPTSEEAVALQDEMESFCSDFKDFEERLEAKGITVQSRVSMAPPIAEYATIINVSEYTITAAKPVKETAVKVRGTRSKAVTKRALQKEDD